MGATGTTEVDFGAFPGSLLTSVNVTGQGDIQSTSLVEAWLFPVATEENTADEHLIAAGKMEVIAGNISDGVGFTIYAMVRNPETEPLGPAYRERHTASGTAGTDQGSFQNVTGSVGGKVTNKLIGKFTVAWVWV